jgi:molybdenum cofactor synthesis domain-containing protein
MKAVILTISDRCHEGTREDESGPCLVAHVQRAGWDVVETAVLPDDQLAIVKKLLALTEESDVNLILTTGGTGAGPRDVTPEATRMVIERPFPGIAEALRSESMKHAKFAMLSRGEAGSRGRALIVNLPGSPKAVDQLWPVLEPVVGHACRLLAGVDDPHS